MYIWGYLFIPIYILHRAFSSITTVKCFCGYWIIVSNCTWSFKKCTFFLFTRLKLWIMGYRLKEKNLLLPIKNIDLNSFSAFLFSWNFAFCKKYISSKMIIDLQTQEFLYQFLWYTHDNFKTLNNSLKYP